MEKEHKPISVEEYFEKVPNGEVLILILKREDRTTDRHDLQRGVTRKNVAIVPNCEKRSSTSEGHFTMFGNGEGN